MKKILSIILFVFILLSCSSTKKPQEKLEETTKLPFYNDSLKTLQIEGTLDIAMQDMDQNVSLEIKVKEQSEIAMNIFGPFGIEVAKIHSDAEKLTFFNVFQGIVLQGKPSSQNLKKVANIYLTFNELISITRCEIPALNKMFKFVSEEKEVKKFISSDNSSIIETVYVDKFGLLKKYEKSNIHKIKILEVSFDDYKSVNNFKLAHQISINFPLMKGILKIDIDNYKLNQKLEDLKLKIPSSIKIKEID